MKIRMTKNHRGWETNEQRVNLGDVLELDDDKAQALIDNGWAESLGASSVNEEQPEEVIYEDPESDSFDEIEVEIEVYASAGEEISYDEMSYNEVRTECKKRGIVASGTKAELIEKLKAS